MAYVPKNWALGDAITESDLDHIETGIKDRSDWETAHDAPPYARALRTTASDLPDTTWGDIYFDTQAFDTAAMFVPGNTFTIKKAGLYLISAEVTFTVNVDGSRQARIFLNDTSAIASASTRACTSGNATILNLATVYPLVNVGDTLKLQVYQDSGIYYAHIAGAKMAVTWLGAYTP